jgi:hypothetical protein
MPLDRFVVAHRALAGGDDTRWIAYILARNRASPSSRRYIAVEVLSPDAN